MAGARRLSLRTNRRAHQAHAMSRHPGRRSGSSQASEPREEEPPWQSIAQPETLEADPEPPAYAEPDPLAGEQAGPRSGRGSGRADETARRPRGEAPQTEPDDDPETRAGERRRSSPAIRPAGAAAARRDRTGGAQPARPSNPKRSSSGALGRAPPDLIPTIIRHPRRRSPWTARRAGADRRPGRDPRVDCARARRRRGPRRRSRVTGAFAAAATDARRAGTTARDGRGRARGERRRSPYRRSL